jgi:hypothetical protein
MSRISRVPYLLRVENFMGKLRQGNSDGFEDVNVF